MTYKQIKTNATWGAATVNGFTLQDLREDPDPARLDDFIALYNRTFTDQRERENPSEWLRRMGPEVPAHQPRTHVLVAVSADSPSNGGGVIGGIVFEHYRGSHCGLLTYLVVEPAWRRKGIARALVQVALSTLVRAESASGGRLKAVFCEVEDPRRVPDERSAMPTCQRLNALLRLGARLIEFDYIQPRLVGGAGTCDYLRLMVFETCGEISASAPGRPLAHLDGSIVLAFLEEFYQGLGTAKPWQDADFNKMARQIHGDLTMHDPREKPALSLKAVAVALHFVTSRPDEPPAGKLPYPACISFQSMELDLLSYGYQVQKLLGSQREQKESIAVEIEFPERVDYHSEGRHMLLLPIRRRCRARAMISSTLFLSSGIRVWHLVLVPDDDEAFTEFDLIKLIHLYDGRTEGTNLGRRIWFRINGQAGEKRVTAEGILPALLGDKPELRKACNLTAGTVQVVTGKEPGLEGQGLADVMKAVLSVRGPGGEEAFNNLAKWISEGTPQGRALLALCGVVSGIFDFPEIDVEEAIDTMEPTFASPGAFIRIHRCTLVSISEEDRVMVQVRESIGLSPYLLLPHAALLHNEALILDSEEIMARVSTARRIGLRQLENARGRIENNLNRLYLPNVFNYVTEKTLFEKGAEGRGTDERKAAAHAKLQALDGQVTSAWERRHDHGQMRIAALLAVFTVVGLRDILFDVMRDTFLEPYSWWMLGGLAGIVVVLYALWGVKRSV